MHRHEKFFFLQIFEIMLIFARPKISLPEISTFFFPVCYDSIANLFTNIDSKVNMEEERLWTNYLLMYSI